MGPTKEALIIAIFVSSDGMKADICLKDLTHRRMSQGLLILGNLRFGPWEHMLSEIFLSLSSFLLFKSLASLSAWLISTICSSRLFWEIPRFSSFHSIFVAI